MGIGLQLVQTGSSKQCLSNDDQFRKLMNIVSHNINTVHSCPANHVPPHRAPKYNSSDREHFSFVHNLPRSPSLPPFFFRAPSFSLSWMTLTDRLVATGTTPCLLCSSEAARCEIHNTMARMGSKPESISKAQQTAINLNHEKCTGDYLHFNRSVSCKHKHTHTLYMNIHTHGGSNVCKQGWRQLKEAWGSFIIQCCA